jgi:hypothetical protein
MTVGNTGCAYVCVCVCVCKAYAGISSKGMSIMNIFDKIANEAGKLVRYSRHPHVARDPDRVWTVQDHFSFIKKIKINFKGYI